MKFSKRPAPLIQTEILYHCVARYGVWTYASWPGPAPVVTVQHSVLFFLRNFVCSYIWIGMFYVFFPWRIQSNVALFWWHPLAWCRVPQSFKPLNIIAFVNQISNPHQPQGAFTTGFYSQALIWRLIQFHTILTSNCKQCWSSCNKQLFTFRFKL